MMSSFPIKFPLLSNKYAIKLWAKTGTRVESSCCWQKIPVKPLGQTHSNDFQKFYPTARKPRISVTIIKTVLQILSVSTMTIIMAGIASTNWDGFRHRIGLFCVHNANYNTNGQNSFQRFPEKYRENICFHILVIIRTQHISERYKQQAKIIGILHI